MGIFDFFKKKKRQETFITPQNTVTISVQKPFTFHPDLDGLIWFADGEHKGCGKYLEFIH